MCGQPGSASDGHQGGHATEQRSQAPVAGARDQVTIPLIPGAPRSELGIVVCSSRLVFDCRRQLWSSYSWWSMFNRGGVGCGAASDGNHRGGVRLNLLAALLTFDTAGLGGDGCLLTPGGGAPGLLAPPEGGGGCAGAPPPGPSSPAAPPELPPAIDPPAAAARAPPARRPAPASALAPTMTAADPSVVTVETRSPPVSAGDPPSTAANSFGICQHSIMKMSAAPITSKADIAGVGEVPTPAAIVCHPTAKSIPAPISRYSSMILTPVETPRAM